MECCICAKQKAKESEEASRTCFSRGEVGAIRTSRAKAELEKSRGADTFLTGGREAVTRVVESADARRRGKYAQAKLR